MTSLLDVLALTPRGGDLFSAAGGRGGWVSLFGGQLVAQAVDAATRTVEPDRVLHSLHAYFLREGAFDVPLDYAVEHERDGRAFSVRHVTAAQRGKRVLSLTASFHVEEPGPARDTLEMPDVPPPDGLARAKDAGGDFAGQSPLAFVEARPIEGCQPFAPELGEPYGQMWLRIPSAVGASRAENRILLVYLSDLFLINTAIRPHFTEMGAQSQVASLDHTIWIHDDPQVSEWMLYVQDSPWAGKARAMCRGSIFSSDGRHIATIAQEALVRTGRRE